MTNTDQTPPALNLVRLTVEVANRTGRSPSDVQEVVQAVLDSIGATLAVGGHVRLNNFGSFEPSRRTYRSGILADGKTHSGVVDTVSFKLSGRLKYAVRNRTPEATLRRSPKSY